jgi:hypothetical protein
MSPSKKLVKLNSKLKRICIYYGIVSSTRPVELRKIWKKTGLNYYDLADKLFISPEQCYKYLYGRVKGIKSNIDFTRKVNALEED